MTSAAGRKKSVISTSAQFIDIPVATNTALNKAASQSTSLYQQCSSLRARLMRVHDFSVFFSLYTHPESSSARRSTDPVTQLWDCFVLGVPLCFLFNLLPNVQPIVVDTSSFDPTDIRTRKRAIAQFAMNVHQLEDCGTFTVTDLWDRNSTDGFVKVVNIVTTLVDSLPEDVFIDDPPASPPLFSPKDSSDSLPTELFSAGPKDAYPGSQVVTELIHTERKYVQDLETMQRYATAAAQSNTIDQDTIHLLFPGLNKLLNFQRRFLIKLEGIWELPWNERQWGSPFVEFEEEFAVYEPYCANYTSASEIMLQEEHHLSVLDDILNVKAELPAFLIKPVQRICKYPLLLESLVKTLNKSDEYSYMEDLKAGVAAAKRITDRINEEQRRAENLATLKNLEGRVEDWKGHHISNFGALLLDDIFMVTKSEMDREYHVFLFEKIILCCKEYVTIGPNGKKINKTNSILKKQGVPAPLNLPGAPGSKKKSTPLLLKGRIFLNNVTSAIPKVHAGQYSLAVYWKGDDDLEYFTLRCRNEEQLRLWENQLNRLIQEVAARRTSETRNMHMRFTHVANSTSPAPSSRQNAQGDRTMSMFSQTTSASTSALSPYPGPYSSRSGRFAGSVLSEDQSLLGGPAGYPPSHDGFDPDQDDEYEDYPTMSSGPASGRGTPIGTPRHTLPSGYGSVRSSSSGVSPLLSSSAYATTPRASTARSSQGGEYAAQRPSLRSQFSSARLRDTGSNSRSESRASGPSPLPPPGYPPMRSRSASQPTAYVPRPAPAPPLPTTPWEERPQHPIDSKRGSGSSQSTGDNSSDYSPTSGSPITPYGSSDSSLSGLTGGRGLHDKVLASAAHQLQFAAGGGPVKVKVHFHEDIFVIQVPRSTEYNELVERVGKKIRLCGPRRDDGPLRVKYVDEDGDLVSLGSTEDVQMAFESVRPGSQVTLYVQ